MTYIDENLKEVVKNYTVSMVLIDFILAIFVLLTFPFFIMVGLFNFIRNSRDK